MEKAVVVRPTPIIPPVKLDFAWPEVKLLLEAKTYFRPLEL
jgi:hypothetical protein